MKAATVKATAPKLKQSAQIRDLVDNSLLFIDELESSDQYATEMIFATTAEQAVVKLKDKALSASIQNRHREVEALATEFAAAAKARDTLKSSPTDTEARQVWGNWLSLRKDNWMEGLQLLQGASDPALKRLATLDLKAPQDKAAMIQLGKDWLDYAKSSKDRSRSRYAARALYWLTQAIQESTGIEKTKLETLIEQAEKTLNRSSPMVQLLEVVSRKLQRKEHTRLPLDKSDKRSYQEFPPEGAVLIGFICCVGKYGSYTVVTAIQPVFAVKSGQKAVNKVGAWIGTPDGQTVEVLARDGYALSNLGHGTGAVVDSIKLRFSRVTRSGLNLSDSYESKPIGGPREISAWIRGEKPDNQPFIGLSGMADAYLRTMAPITTK